MCRRIGPLACWMSRLAKGHVMVGAGDVGDVSGGLKDRSEVQDGSEGCPDLLADEAVWLGALDEELEGCPGALAEDGTVIGDAGGVFRTIGYPSRL